jgi:site-specific recombinase XerD
MTKIRITIYPNDAKRSKDTFRTPLYLRIRKNREKVEIRLDWDLSRNERELWNETLQRVESKSSSTNDFIDKIAKKFDEYKIKHAFEEENRDLNEIKLLLSGRSSDLTQIPTILEYANSYYDNTIQNNMKYRKGTKTNYRKAINHFEKFLQSMDGKPCQLSKLNFKLANSFKDYLLSSDNTSDKSSMSEVSALNHVKKFRTIFDLAVNEGLINSNPFKLVKLSNQSPRKAKLSIYQLVKIHRYALERSEDNCITAQLFLFMAFTGTAFTDCMQLTNDNLEYTPNGVKLSYTRIKTGNVSSQFLSSAAFDILKAFDVRPDVKTSIYLVPQLSNQFFNRELKVMADELEIPITITSHIARHSFRSLLDEADIIDPVVINKIMGWSSRNLIDSIYRDVTDKRLIKTKLLLDDFLNLTIGNGTRKTRNKKN